MHILIRITVLLLLSLPALADCWTSEEISNIDGFAEFEDKIIISLKDAVDCKPLTGATMTMNGHTFTADPMGYVILPAEGMAEVEDAQIPVQFTANGYIPMQTQLRIMLGSLWNTRFLMSKPLAAQSVRFVLQWDRRPRDLDLHLVSHDLHISYQNMKNVPNRARLDRDDTNGYGPETITLDRIEQGHSYRLYVHNYSQERTLEKARGILTVYVDNKLHKVVDLPDTEQNAIHLMSIENGLPTYVMQPTNRIE